MRKRTNAAWLGNLRGVRHSRHARPGFTLIISLSLMVLLVVVAVGLLGLSTLTLRSGKQGEYAARARANARMALMLAIGNLQKNAGLDTRVTARADILDANNPPVLGVWKSWEGTDHNLTGNMVGQPVSPAASGTYKSKKQDRFLSWLVSGSEEQDTTVPTTRSGTGTVALVGQKTVGDGSGRDKLEIHLTPTQIVGDSGKGAYAWWIGGENQKARLPKPYQPDGGSSGKWASVAKSHTVADPLPFRMEKLLDDASPADRAVSLSTSDFVGEKKALNVSQEFFYDLSTTSVGLLTNTATGGWRKDMSTLTENWASIPNSGLPFFRLSPGNDLNSSKPTPGNATPAKGMLYPWAAYRGTPSDIPIYRNGAVASWENLKEYALMYRGASMQTSSSGYAKIKSYAVPVAGDGFTFLHRIRLLPVIARIQWVFSYYAVDSTDTPGAVVPKLLVNPVITMWNPYNVELNLAPAGSPVLSFLLQDPLPVALKATIGSTATDYKSILAGCVSYSAYTPKRTLGFQIQSNLTLKPGETRVFSANTITEVATSDVPLVLNPNYSAKGGHSFSILGQDSKGKDITAPASANIKMDAVFDADYDDANAKGVGIYLDMAAGATVGGLNVVDLAYRMTITRTMAQAAYKKIPSLVQTSLSNAKANPVPFLSTIFGARTASNTIMPAKGFVQSSPFVMYTAMGGKDQIEATIRKHYVGTGHPVNSPFDFSFVAHASGGDDYLPNANDKTGRGYIVSGFNKARGLSTCVIDELPTRPLQSLCELQNWDLRFENPIPPYAFNIIGNSDATPLIPANDVVDKTNSGDPKNLQYDDSYCANHVLFDDWFLSSIAPDPDSYGNAGRNMQTTYTDLLTGTKPLPNRAYHAIAEDIGASASNPTAATQIYTDHVKNATGWKTIASRLEVEGMFNVNSTSVTAWRALLGHARNQVVPFQKDGSVGLSGKTDHAVSRFSIAGDVETGASGISGAFEGSSQFTGYRVFSDSLLDTLAQEIVKQVRLRGPFLSLSEFINRQLSSGDPALAGAVQSALNQMAKGGGNPFSYLQGNSADAVAAPPSSKDAEYRYPDAAVGKSAYGLPGWTRQADILRPLAPILSARDDTFVIRTHGDARDDDGNVVSSAVCEAIVRRTRDYVDPADAADITGAPTSSVNQTFGRRFEVVSFRWLSPAEI